MKTVQSGLKEITIKNMIDNKNEIIDKPTLMWRVYVILISWMAFIGFDFLWHAGFMAALWTRPNPALLGAEQLFLRIPFGYLSFLVCVVMMYWFFLNIGINDWKNGISFGVKFGVLLGVANTLGQFSILTVDPIMLIGWAMGYTIEFSIIGGIIGAANSKDHSLKRLFIVTFTLVIILIIITIILQIVGLAPPMTVIE